MSGIRADVQRTAAMPIYSKALHASFKLNLVSSGLERGDGFTASGPEFQPHRLAT